MHLPTRLLTTATAVALAGAAAFGGLTAAPAGAAGAARTRAHRPSDHAVFVETDNPAGNQVIAYDSAPNGSLHQAGVYATRGLGGQLSGSVVDHTASEGALALDARHDRLYAVNAGSDTVSVFSIDGDRLQLRQVVNSGGDFPVSVAVHDDLVEVLNARSGGSVQGFFSVFGYLLPLPGNRPLGLDPTASPEFVNTPGQVAFSPDGSKVLVTTKANTNSVDVFAVGRDGRLSSTPVVNTFAGAVPFGITFDPEGHAVIAAAAGTVSTYTLESDGTLAAISSLPTNESATCWIVADGSRLYASNAGSATVGGFSGDAGGNLTALGDTGTDAGTIDAAVSAGGGYLYVRTGAAGLIDAFRVNTDGSLSPIGSVTVPDGVGGEGIVAS